MPLHWQGRELAARPGQSVAAALLENGVRSWRRTRRGGRPRGLFCGIGACYDCLVRLDGGPEVRACLVPVSPGLRVDPGGAVPEHDPCEQDPTRRPPERDAVQHPTEEDA
ncbi:2Fe-2S iron-sulfur cluster binding domain-containing protein [Auraticoccus monumenti]|uniref:2Fe-2S iron-sulfur cluster binding domain-containing protein n=1 Tax=Auraticoccus monumenti TaxID=675864 RepID=A0A1G7CFS0_9ACTN|nr:2Fe-2S iron-sulfur cluster binding domain-containing protein [Auraticoccus monumenti]